MYGVVEFYKKCLKQGVKPIIGMEGYTTNINLTERPERGKFQNFHLLLLAKDKEGYKNLMKLTSLAHIEGYYYRPRVDWEILEKYSEGLIVLSGCLSGPVSKLFRDGRGKEAVKTAQKFKDLFKDDKAFSTSSNLILSESISKSLPCK